MTKLEFLKELESLLPDIPLEEREEALRYYNGYFEDAGEDQEEEIIKEIGSPSKVAAIIKADLNSNEAERENRGYFTEKGYQDTSYREEKFELIGSDKIDADHNNSKAGNSSNDRNDNPNNNKGNYSNSNNNANCNFNSNAYSNVNNNSNGNNYSNTNSSTNNGYGYNANGNQNTQGPNSYNNGQPNGAQYSNTNNQQRKNNSNNTALYLIIGIFTFPIWFPFLLSAFGIAIGIIATILGIIFGFGVAGITMIGVGVALFFAGLVQISAPFIGVLLIGTGLLVLGLGMLFTIACILLCKNVLPAFIKGIVHLCRLPFKNRSVMA